MKLRQNVLDYARQHNIRYVFFVDTDNFITNPDTLNILISRNKGIVAPMLKINKDVLYSNYWAGKFLKYIDFCIGSKLKTTTHQYLSRLQGK